MINIKDTSIDALYVGNEEITKVYLGTEQVYPTGQPSHDYSQDYLTFVALEDGTFKFSGNSINYSVDDGQTWTALAANTNSPTVTAGNKILWKASGLTTSSTFGIGIFSSSIKYDIEGNIMSLEYGDDFVGQTDLSGKDNVFRLLFSGNSKIVSAENLVLPATTLSYRCYGGMFQNCGHLAIAPELPATTLSEACYVTMFYGCASLTTAPELPATTLAGWCYQQMFYNCTSLNEITCLATNISATSCVNQWVSNVSATGTFIKNPSMSSWTTGSSGVPSGWTIQDYQ